MFLQFVILVLSAGGILLGVRSSYPGTQLTNISYTLQLSPSPFAGKIIMEIRMILVHSGIISVSFCIFSSLIPDCPLQCIASYPIFILYFAKKSYQQ